MRQALKTMMLGVLLFTGCGTSTTVRRHLPPLTTVGRVDLDRYLGTWHEIASFPQSFQRGCTGLTANYSLRSDGQIDVVNRCRKNSLDGEEKIAKGRARVVDRTTNAKLEVSFFRPFWGDCWIVNLWILCRTRMMDALTYDGIVARLRAQAYEVDRLRRTLQPGSS